ISHGWLGSRGTGTDQLYQELEVSPSSGRSVVLGVHTDGRPLMNHSSGRRPEQPSHPVSGPSVTQGRCPLIFSSPTETDEVIDPPHRSILRVRDHHPRGKDAAKTHPCVKNPRECVGQVRSRGPSGPMRDRKCPTSHFTCTGARTK